MPADDRRDSLSRRALLGSLAAAGAAIALSPLDGIAELARRDAEVLKRAIPSSGEKIPLVGLGTSRTFNVGKDQTGLDRSAEVMRKFFEGGGQLIDCSPMYGSSQSVIGYGLKKLGHPKALFSADKVWTREEGPPQIKTSLETWEVPKFDLLQVHNLLKWEEHLPMLHEMKAAGKLRYVGITTSGGRDHEEYVKIMKGQKLDFIQVSYNVLDRQVEAKILPIAAEKGIAVIVNRPFRQGVLTKALEGKPLPGWAEEIGCVSWAQVLLKFVISHPTVTCPIPATTQPEHAAENMAAARDPLPDEAMRKRIASTAAELIG